jgi:hypothetical protein
VGGGNKTKELKEKYTKQATAAADAKDGEDAKQERSVTSPDPSKLHQSQRLRQRRRSDKEREK